MADARMAERQMPMVQVDREVRIAVVMYGGSSLAIYMNGVAQELLQLVRATSPNACGRQALTGTARVYRKLAHVLAGTPLDALTDELVAAPPRVRFVIDILSGTSAGGINAVMLAKALARNTELTPLARLWLEKGAVDVLLNDRQGATRRAPYRLPVKALFNSDKMYLELLGALGALNAASGAERPPLVEDLELVVTGTDLEGRVIDLRLADGVAQERDHRHAFTFRLEYMGGAHGRGASGVPVAADATADQGTADDEAAAAYGVDEFTAAFDPLLAFAARTTSSLPAVFEPAVAAHARTLAGGSRRADADWGTLFRGVPERDRDAYLKHALADGGYLDNKPFGHAIDRLASVAGGTRVTRKLFYLEPAPERIDPDAPPEPAPNALENTLDVVSLARYETIRADLRRIEQRNHLVYRLRTLQAGVLEDVLSRSGGVAGAAHEDGAAREGGEGRSVAEEAGNAAPRDLSDLTAAYGPAYGGYHRLRVATVTDDLAAAVADVARIAEHSDLRRSLGLVARAYRNAHYRRDATEAQEPESAFLRRFDLAFHRRRARFLLGKVDQLLALDGQVVRELEHAAAGNPAIARVVAAHREAGRSAAEPAWEEARPPLRVAKTLAQRAAHALAGAMPGADERLQAVLAPLLRPEAGERADALRAELLALLAPADDAGRYAATEAFVRRHPALVDGVMTALERDRAARITSAEDAVRDLWRIDVADGLQAEVRALLVRYWETFTDFDLVQFPLLEATGVGEELSPVEVHRISATDDGGYYGDAFAEGKLRGTRFASFGAFLDERWRAHDIAWGRLDGAERLIASLLGDAAAATEGSGERERLIAEAHEAILLDSYPTDRDAILALGRRKADTVRYLERKGEGMELDPRSAARDLSRATRVVGELSDAVTAESRLPRPLRWLLRTVTFLSANVVDAAIPKTFRHLLASYWAQLVLLFGAVLLVLGLPLLPWTLRGGVVWGGILVVAAGVFLGVRRAVWGWLARRQGRRRARRR